MSASRAALHVLPDVDDEYIEVSRIALERVVASVDSLADDIEAGLAAATHRGFARNWPAVLNELHRIGLRVQRAREDLEPIGGRPPTTRPRRLA